MQSSYLVNRKQKKNYLQLHKTCCNCNSKATTIDHIIPCHLFNITMETEYEYRQAVRDRDNWQAMCSCCNAKKSSTFDVNTVPKFLYERYKPYIDLYIDVRHKLYVKENGECSCCHKHMTEEECIIYLKDQQFTVSETNGYILCVDCLRISNRS